MFVWSLSLISGKQVHNSPTSEYIWQTQHIHCNDVCWCFWCRAERCDVNKWEDTSWSVPAMVQQLNTQRVLLVRVMAEMQLCNLTLTRTTKRSLIGWRWCRQSSCSWSRASLCVTQLHSVTDTEMCVEKADARGQLTFLSQELHDPLTAAMLEISGSNWKSHIRFLGQCLYSGCYKM